jgi:maltose alpha-D-glucosyltransferase/alpha-amylase
VSPLAEELIGTYLESARLLGRRTAELHLALAAATDPNFAPEPFTDFYRQSLYHGMVGLTSASMLVLRRGTRQLPEPQQAEARRVLALEGDIKKRFEAIRDRRIHAMRIRLHGDLHLGEFLYTGRDFVLIDFEGAPHRPLSERRIKRSPLRDCATMLRSFHYISHGALHGQIPGVPTRAEHKPVLEGWARFWNRWVGLAFLREYLETAGSAPFLPKTRENLGVLLYTYLLEKAVHEVAYEAQNRPEWLPVPIQGILQLMEAKWGG